MRVLYPTAANIEEAVAVLRRGGVVAHPTETCYGFACDLANLDAVKKVFALKQRPEDKPVSALFASVEDAKNYVVWTDRAEELAKIHLPGPLTLILPMRGDMPVALRPAPSIVHSLGVRVSPQPVALALVTAFGSPLSTTSANVHGEPNPYGGQEIFERFADEKIQPDLILDFGVLPQVPPSKIVDLTTPEEAVLRQ
jgi:L-threonylcarbamoyladenylate synthase